MLQYSFESGCSVFEISDDLFLNSNSTILLETTTKDTSLTNKPCSSMTLLCCLNFYKFKYSWYADLPSLTPESA